MTAERRLAKFKELVFGSGRFTVADRGSWNHFGNDSGVADYHKTSKYTDHRGLDEGVRALCLTLKWTKGE